MNRTVALAFLVSLGTTACGSDTGEVSGAIRSLTRDHGSTEIRLTAVTKFTWDKVYFFGPYMPRSKICEALAVQPKYCERVVPFESADDSVMTLAFVEGSRVVHCARHLRWNGDFTPLPQRQPIPAAKAVFRVVPSGTASDGTVWLRLVLNEA